LLLKKDENIAFIIPTLHPRNVLLKTIEQLIELLDGEYNSIFIPAIIVVDDGSGFEYEHIFEQVKKLNYCVLLVHAANLGMGRALKTAFNYCLVNFKNLVCAVALDSDGQHLAEDACTCAKEAFINPDTFILGSRDFESIAVPFKSRFGNKITRKIARYFCGLNVCDTQTGLRCVPFSLMRKLISVPGERFEYQMNVLIETAKANIKIKEVKISTIYIDQNKHTNFRPIIDSARIYLVFVKYLFSSLSSLLIDIMLFSWLIFFTKNVLPFSYIMVATIFSRIVSSVFNYLFNSRFVFSSKGGNKSFFKYYALMFFQMLMSGLSVSLLSAILPSFEIQLKLIVDSCLFFASFYVQRKLVFV